MRGAIKNLKSLGKKGLLLTFAATLFMSQLSIIQKVSADPTSINVIRSVDKTGNIQTYSGFPSTVQKVFAKYDVIFGLDTNGDLYGLGYNACGLLGDPNTVGTSVTVARKVEGISNVIDVSVVGATRAAVALKSDGSVWSWGCSDFLGRAYAGAYDIVPNLVSGISNGVEVEGSFVNVLVRTNTGTVYAWGPQGGTIGSPVYGDLSPTPVQIVGFDNAIDISASGTYNLALKSDGSLWQWGVVSVTENAGGFFPYYETPSLISQFDGVSIAGIEVSNYSAYVITQAGTLYAWGTDCFGSLGLSSVNYTTCQTTNSNVLNPTVSSIVTGALKITGSLFIAAVQTSSGLTILGGGSCSTCTFNNPSQVYTPGSVTGLNILDFSAGYEGLVYFVTVASDTTPPTVTGVPTTQPNGNGWYKNNVVVNWSVSDPAPSSGTPTQPPQVIASQEGTHTYTSAQSCDPANNCATGSIVLKIDKSLPTASNINMSGLITITVPIVNITINIFPVIVQSTNITATVSDQVSSVTNAEYYFDNGTHHAMSVSGNTASATASLTSLTPGQHTVYVRSQDAAGNWSTVTSKTFTK